ncbi:MAG: hypothetical protein WBV82_30970 [Myxococcaceae bacterium]
MSPTPLVDGDLVIERFQPTPELVRLDWKGRADCRAPDEVLSPFLAEVLEVARTAGATIEMHFEYLEDFGPGLAEVLVTFLRRARGARVPLYLSYRQSNPWQNASFEALSVFEQLDPFLHLIPADEGAGMHPRQATGVA